MTPPLVQEPFPTTQRIGQEEFVFVVCQQGAEATLKSQLLAEGGPLRLAFSRPGVLTFKIAANSELVPSGWLIRQSGYAFRTIKGENAAEMVAQALELAGNAWNAVHVFQRDRALPGLRGFEPGPTELTKAIGMQFATAFQAIGGQPDINSICPLGSRVLDVLLIEPDQWLIGHHLATERHQCWPGGAFPLSTPAEMVSRAYLKMSEALAWSGLPIESGDEIVEIGSAPGGSCQRLLDLGLKVTGVDPAEMDPMILGHERFEHWRNKAAGVRRKSFAKFRWLAADASAAPSYTLDAVEDIVTYSTSGLEGLLLTLKLSTYSVADNMHELIDRVRNWGFERVEVRQLASNRRECCLVAQRAADWRRPSRVAAMQQAAKANAEKRRARTAKKRAES
jgi:23S rRNA (cytidine2498-2'-O)-methyltransferase